MIRIERINKYYSSPQGSLHALRDIDINVKSGEIYGIIGHSGAGKSSLLHCINLLEQPSDGKVWFNDIELTALQASELRQQRQQMGMIFQHFNLLSRSTVYENVAFPLKLQHYSRQEISNRVMPLLALTSMIDKKDAYPAQLSGGQKQRVAIARALANEPKLLLCDEATSALDPETTRSVLQLLLKINQQLGLTIILISHEMEVVKMICDRVALIEQGEIVREEKTIDFFVKSHAGKSMQFLNSYLEQTLPAILKENLKKSWQSDSKPVLRIYFYGESAKQPLIADMIKNLGVDINIIQGTIEYIKENPMGQMVVSIGQRGNTISEQQLQKVIAHIHKQGLYSEVIGYV